MAFTEGLCENIQLKLNNVAGANAPQLKRDRAGYLEAVVSETNTAGVEKIQLKDTGKFNKVRVVYANRGTEAEVDLVCTQDCDATVEREPLEEIVDVDKCISTKGLIFDEDQMRKLCEGDEMWIANTVMGQMNAVNVALNKQMLGLQAANFGKFIDGTVIKDVKLFADSDNSPRAIAAAQIAAAYGDTGASGIPLIIGGGNLDLFMRMNQIAAVNGNTGTDLSKWSDYRYYNDRFVPGVIGAEEFIVLAPGAVQLITWNKYVGSYAKRNDVFEHGTITDPFTGITYDIKVHYDDCADVWSIKFFLNWKMWFLPANAFAATDELFGVNYTFNFSDCSTIIGCEEGV